MEGDGYGSAIKVMSLGLMERPRSSVHFPASYKDFKLCVDELWANNSEVAKNMDRPSRNMRSV